MSPTRPIRPFRIAVDDRCVYVADAVLPVVARIDISTGQLVQEFWWPLSEEHRGHVACSSLLVHGETLWISSPGAGGVVWIDCASGAASRVELETVPGRLVAGDGDVWVVVDLELEDDDESAPDARLAADALPRPIVSAAPRPEPEPPSQWHLVQVGVDSDEFEDFDDDDHDFAPDDEPPRPVWRVGRDRAERVDFGGDVANLVSLPGSELLFVVRRPDDPVVKRNLAGWIEYESPGVLARRNAHGEIVVLVDLPDVDGGRLFVGDNTCWLSGFGLPERYPDREPGFFDGPVAFHRVDLGTGEMTEAPTAMQPLAMVGAVAVEIEIERSSSFGGRVVRCSALSIDLESGTRRHVELPIVVDVFGDALVHDGKVWFIGEAGDAVVRLDPSSAVAEGVTIHAEIRVPEPEVPPGLDLEDYEQRELEGFKSVTRTPPLGSGIEPLIRGVVFESVELLDEFPRTCVVAQFRSDERPGILFARRWHLYDELGNPANLEYADVGLMEDVEAAGYGLPPIEECRPDAEGIVWF